MISLSKFLLKSQRKHAGVAKENTGFTLIELLVGLVLASLVITPLMTFMLNIVESDRNEQAKANSNQEIQSALDFIAQDLKQAVYIYDSSGLNNISTTSSVTSGIKDQIPPVAADPLPDGAPGCKMATPTCVPVLVFWKREPKLDSLPLPGSSAKVDDTFVYSLVAYYLVKGEISSGNWSDAARISRFQISNGVINPSDPTNVDGTPKYITGEAPDFGFLPFDLTIIGTTLTQKMNRWRKAGAAYRTNAFTLVDFIDESTTGITPNCPTTTPANLQQVPSTLVGGFYACVDSSRTSAQIYIRGNALARIENNHTYNVNKLIYFPTASVQVKGIGLLGIE